MVAVVTGAGLGLFNASNNVLGTGGVLGQALQGEDGSLAWVNAASGNLVLQDVDTSLSGVGVDLALLRTYNAQGTLTSAANGLGWSWDEERTVTLTTGTVNTSGSQVTRTTGDGASSVYTFNGTAYVSSAGDGAHDSLTYNATTHQWTWVESSTRQVDVYGDSQNATTTGRLLSQTDESGNAITLQYDASGHLTDVTDLGDGSTVSRSCMLSAAHAVRIGFEIPTTRRVRFSDSNVTPIHRHGPDTPDRTHLRLRRCSTDCQ